MKQTNQQKSETEDLRTELYTLIDKAVMNQRAVDERKIAPEQRDEMNVKNCNNLIEEFLSQPHQKSEMEWEKEFRLKFGGTEDKIAVNLNGEVYLMDKLNEAIDFISNLLAQSRQQFAEEIIQMIKSNTAQNKYRDG